MRSHPVCATDTDSIRSLVQLVEHWLTVKEVAAVIGGSPRHVHRLIEDGQLLSLRWGQPPREHVPAALLADGAPLAALAGTITVLADGRLSGPEMLEWLFTPQPDFGDNPSPVAALRSGVRSEVRRCAMEQAW